MDDKSINLWRQIEESRRAGRRQAVHPREGQSELARQRAGG
jgi:hypothetical protein